MRAVRTGVGLTVRVLIVLSLAFVFGAVAFLVALNVWGVA